MTKAVKLNLANLMALYLRDVADELDKGTDPKVCADELRQLSADYLMNKVLTRPKFDKK